MKTLEHYERTHRGPEIHMGDPLDVFESGARMADEFYGDVEDEDSMLDTYGDVEDQRAMETDPLMTSTPIQNFHISKKFVTSTPTQNFRISKFTDDDRHD